MQCTAAITAAVVVIITPNHTRPYIRIRRIDAFFSCAVVAVGFADLFLLFIKIKVHFCRRSEYANHVMSRIVLESGSFYLFVALV